MANKCYCGLDLTKEIEEIGEIVGFNICDKFEIDGEKKNLEEYFKKNKLSNCCRSKLLGYVPNKRWHYFYNKNTIFYFVLKSNTFFFL